MFLEFYVFGERVIVWGGRVRNISSPLGGRIKYFPTLLGGGGGAKFYGRILEYPPSPQYTYFMTGPLLGMHFINNYNGLEN